MKKIMYVICIMVILFGSGCVQVNSHGISNFAGLLNGVGRNAFFDGRNVYVNTNGDATIRAGNGHVLVGRDNVSYDNGKYNIGTGGRSFVKAGRVLLNSGGAWVNTKHGRIHF